MQLLKVVDRKFSLEADGQHLDQFHAWVFPRSFAKVRVQFVSLLHLWESSYRMFLRRMHLGKSVVLQNFSFVCT